MCTVYVREKNNVNQESTEMICFIYFILERCELVRLRLRLIFHPAHEFFDNFLTGLIACSTDVTYCKYCHDWAFTDEVTFNDSEESRMQFYIFQNQSMRFHVRRRLQMSARIIGWNFSTNHRVDKRKISEFSQQDMIRSAEPVSPLPGFCHRLIECNGCT